MTTLSSLDAWPSTETWLAWSAEERDAHASRLLVNQTLAAQQKARVRTLVADWRAYRLKYPPHPNWMSNRAALVAAVTEHHAEHAPRNRK